MPVIDKDRGYRSLVKNIFGIRRPKITVGIHAQEGNEPKSEDPALTILEVALFNEYGLGVPERSFIRGWFDENRDRAREFIKAALISVAKGKRSRAQALELIGLKFVGEIQARIAQGISPPNAPSTIARKGSSTPLVDKGQLRASVTSKVTG